MSNPIKSLFHDVKVEALGKVTKVHTLSPTSTVEDAVKLFGAHSILSAPVVGEDGALAGMVDMLDVAAFLLSVVPDKAALTADHLGDMCGRAIALRPLSDVMGRGGRDPPVPLNKHSPGSLAMQLFAGGIHRCPVMDDDNKTIVGVVSQSSLIRHLADHIGRGHAKAVGARTLSSLGLGQGGAITAPDTESVIDIIARMDANGISAVALTNEAGELTGNFSVTDMRGLWSDVFPAFVLGGAAYLAKQHPASLRVASVPVETTTVAEVVAAMCERKVHRVWAHDADGKLCGVVSMTDLMTCFQTVDIAV